MDSANKKQPKVVSVSITSPSKKKKDSRSSSLKSSGNRQSLRKSAEMNKEKLIDDKKICQNNSLKQPFKNLQKTFHSKKRVLDEIKQSHKKRVKSQKIDKQVHKILQKRLIDQRNSESILAPLSQKQYFICHQIYKQLDPSNKAQTTIEDLANIKSQKIQQLVMVVYFRKQKNSFFDFIYALWESRQIEQLEESYIVTNRD